MLRVGVSALTSPRTSGVFQVSSTVLSDRNSSTCSLQQSRQCRQCWMCKAALKAADRLVSRPCKHQPLLLHPSPYLPEVP